MTFQLAQQIAEMVDEAANLYHRLVLVVGSSQSGKSFVMHELQDACGWPLVNVNLSLSERLLELTNRQRALKVAILLDDICKEYSSETVLLDNTEILFLNSLKQDPLRLLQNLARNRTIVASWSGTYASRSLRHGDVDHPEFRHYDDAKALIILAERGALSNKTAWNQDHPS